MSEELKPCPFCGGEAERITLQDQDNFGGDVISCKKCECCTRVLFGEKEGLAESWNKRATLKAGQGEAILVEAVAVTKENEDGELYLDWILEGGISALEFPGTTLLVAHGQITDDTGIGEVYTALPASADARLVPVELLERAALHLSEGRLDGPAACELRALLAQSESEVRS